MEHRKLFQSFLNKAKHVYAPSLTAKKIVQKQFPGLNIHVKPHMPLYRFSNIYDSHNLQQPTLNIGVLGAIGEEKGLSVLFNLAKEIDRRKLPIKLVIIGYTGYTKPSLKSITVTGKYDHYNLPSLIKQNKISLFLFPSIWPETYSYVCDEILQLGFPIISFDLGAQRERIAFGQYGWLISLSNSYKGLLEKIIHLEKNRIEVEQKASHLSNNQREVDIILPVFNAYEDLKFCLSSLLQNTDLKSNLIIANDASTDTRVSTLLNSLPESQNNIKIQIITNKLNQGYVSTVNSCLQLSNNHVVLLNSDTVLPKNWLSRLLTPIKQNSKVASVTPFSNMGTICSFPNIYGDPNLPDEYTLEDIDLMFQKLPAGDYLEIPTAVGFCMAMNRNVINKIGIFDEKLFHRGYGEENDWSLRASKKGFINVHLQNLFVYHSQSKSFSSESKALMKKNNDILNRKYPEYRAKVKAYIFKDPAKENRNRVLNFMRTELCPSNWTNLLLG